MTKMRLSGISLLASLFLYACGGGTSTTPPPTVATQFVISPNTSVVTAGAALNITVMATDNLGTLVPSYSGIVHFTSTDAQAVIPPSSQLMGGTGNFSVTFKTAGGQGLQVSDTTGMISGVVSINVNPGSAAQFSLAGVPAAATILIPFNIAVTAFDAYMNVVTSYTGTVQFTSSDAQATLPANSLLTGGTGNFSVTFKTIGSQSFTVSDKVVSSLKASSGSINVVSNAATHLVMVGNPGSVTTRQSFNFTLNALDAANNLSAGYAGTGHFSSTDAQANLPANTTLAAGVSSSLTATLETVGSGSQTIIATDIAASSITGSATISVTAASDPSISSGVPPGGTVGSNYDPHTVRVCVVYNPFRGGCTQYQILQVSGSSLQGTGGVPPYTWSWAPATGSSLPPGLSITNPGNISCPPLGNLHATRPACILGTPTQPGPYNVVVTISDSGVPVAQGTANYTITIANPPAPSVNTTPEPPPGVENQPYSYTFTASGYPPLTWSESGALPAGLALALSTGTLTGTPTQTGSFPIGVTATDQFGQNSPAANFTIVVSAHGFQATGSMTTARTLHTATLLGNGKVFVAGGQLDASNLLASAELFDPSTGSSTATGNMQISRSQHTATLLNDGRVLLAGGGTGTQGNAVTTAELFDSAGGASTATGSMQTARYGHTATLLNTGKVLVVGGINAAGSALASAELFDPSTGTFTPTGSLQTTRRAHTATLLVNGMVLVAGGYDPNSKDLNTAELYDPVAGTFTTVTALMTVTRANHTATLLNTGADAGKVLLAGGFDDNGVARNTAELFDPTAKSFTATNNMVSAHAYHTSTLLASGAVLLVGGADSSGNATSVVEFLDPTTGDFTATGSLVTAREQHVATLLSDGRVLVTGGSTTGSTTNPSDTLSSAEIYQ